MISVERLLEVKIEMEYELHELHATQNILPSNMSMKIGELSNRINISERNRIYKADVPNRNTMLQSCCVLNVQNSGTIPIGTTY